MEPFSGLSLKTGEAQAGKEKRGGDESMDLLHAYHILVAYSRAVERAGQGPAPEPGPTVRLAAATIRAALEHRGVEALVEAGIPREWAVVEEEALQAEKGWLEHLSKLMRE